LQNLMQWREKQKPFAFNILISSEPHNILFSYLPILITS
jgi:hypothetical protein